MTRAPPSPVIQKVVLKDLQEGPPEAFQGLWVVLNPLHVLKEALRRVPDLQTETLWGQWKESRPLATCPGVHLDVSTPTSATERRRQSDTA